MRASGRLVRTAVGGYSVYCIKLTSASKAPCMLPVGFNCHSNIVCLRSTRRKQDVSVLRQGPHIYVAFDASRSLIFRRPRITYDCQVHSGDIVY